MPLSRVEPGKDTQLNRFEYLSVLISIVIALGISEIISTWARLLRHRSVVTFYWIHAYWTVVILLLLIQFWWAFWNYSDLEPWSFGALLAIVAEGIAMVLTGLVLTPDKNIGASLDLKSEFFDNSRLFFLMAAITLSFLTMADVVILDLPLLHIENIVRMFSILLVIIGALSKSEVVHTGIVFATAVLLPAFLYFAIAI